MVLSSLPFIISGYFSRDNVTGECGDVGALSFMPAGASMYQRSAGVPVRVVRCTFEADRFTTATEHGSDWDRRELTACLDIRGTRLGETMLRLAQEIEAPGFASGVLVESLTLGVMVELARYLRRTREPTQTTPGVLARWQLRRVNQYLNEFEGHSPTLSDLAEQCGISEAHLSRLFKSTTGMTVHDYVTDVRVKRAKAYLADTNLALKEISWRLGFSQPACFSVAFRKAVGETPRGYRKQFRHRQRAPRASTATRS
jgi:AraC family transcriptional regulator